MQFFSTTHKGFYGTHLNRSPVVEMVDLFGNKLYLTFIFLIAIVYGDSTSKNCPQSNYTLASGTIISPNYPQDYDNNEDCRYTIFAPLDHHIEIFFDSFDTETCCDFLYLYKGEFSTADNLIARLQGVSPSGQTYTTDTVNIMLLWFTSDLTNVASGFSAHYAAVPNPITTSMRPPNACPPEYYLSSTGTINSPNFPENYPNNADCKYLITVPSGSVVLTFTTFKTEPCCDIVYLYDGTDESAKRIAKLSGTLPVNNMTYQSTQHQMYVEFVSDISNNFEGFSADFHAGSRIG